MSIQIQIRKETIFLDEKSVSVKKMMEQLQLSSQAWLAVRDGVLLTEGDTLRDGETIRMVAVISGGVG